MTHHRHALRVYYEDTDFSGVVYHASYLRFLERGRTELLRDLGIHQSALHNGPAPREHSDTKTADTNVPAPLAFAVRQMQLDFRKAAHMDDWLIVETWVETVGGAQADLGQQVLRGDEVLVSARVKIAAVSGGRASRLPPAMRAAFSARMAQTQIADQ